MSYNDAIMEEPVTPRFLDPKYSNNPHVLDRPTTGGENFKTNINFLNHLLEN